MPLSWAWLTRLAGWIWLAGSTVWFTLAAVRVMRFECCRQRAELAPPKLQAEASRLAKQLGVGRCPAICVVEGGIPPLLWAMTGRATILLPATLLEQMSPSQQAMVLAHEMAHFARRDHWSRWLELVVLGLYWWFPVAWWAQRQLHHAAEQCCDAWVVWLFPDGARCYARSLLQTIDFLSRAPHVLPVGASSLGQFHFHSLQRRFRMILCRSTHRKMPWPLRTAAVVLGMAVLSCSARGVWGQASTGKPPEGKATTPVVAENTDPAAKVPGATVDATQQPEGTAPVPMLPGAKPPDAATGAPAGTQLPTLAPVPATASGAPPNNQPVAKAPAGGSVAPIALPGTPGTADPFVPTAAALPSSLPPPLPHTLLPPARQNDVEQRLQRLEAVTGEILQELKSLHRPNSLPRNDRVVLDWVAQAERRRTGYPRARSDQAREVSAIDEQISRLAINIKEMQARMDQLQAARAKLTEQAAESPLNNDNAPDLPIVPASERAPSGGGPTLTPR
jgi:beta-lactamase regulating signal transducer with metallopeptidase domain